MRPAGADEGIDRALMRGTVEVLLPHCIRFAQLSRSLRPAFAQLSPIRSADTQQAGPTQRIDPAFSLIRATRLAQSVSSSR